MKKKTHNLRKIKFDSEILETWVSQRSGCKKAIGDFRGAWKYRNWLAHGRYWEYNTRYYPPAVLRIIQEMFAKMEITL